MKGIQMIEEAKNRLEARYVEVLPITPYHLARRFITFRHCDEDRTIPCEVVLDDVALEAALGADNA